MLQVSSVPYSSSFVSAPQLLAIFLMRHTHLPLAHSILYGLAQAGTDY
uniref:Uncharacterized protein n=1 Tax=Rhizophora mucronata TaxID=61149 RepID=A0A2P2PUS1_RHIMU